jgi:hypothetical protein
MTKKTTIARVMQATSAVPIGTVTSRMLIPRLFHAIYAALNRNELELFPNFFDCIANKNYCYIPMTLKLKNNLSISFTTD